ncbi:MAG: hypothetical protein JWN76_3800 [Chitinophagaceae bacterium]|nr:hypothetical protein [Chitinophagaceae bacterium]
MTPRFYLSITILFFGVCGHAQQNNNVAKMPRYIEVVMADTVMVQPDNLTFRVATNYNTILLPVDTAAARKNPRYYNERDSLTKVKLALAKDTLVLKLNAAGITILAPTLQEMNSQQYAGALPAPFNVSVSISQVPRLMKIVKGPPVFMITYVSGMAENEEGEYARLMAKLKAKAEVRAAEMAASYNKEVGDLLTIAEYRNAPYNNYGVRNQPGDHLVEIDGKMVNIAYPIHNTVMVRYAFK